MKKATLNFSIFKISFTLSIIYIAYIYLSIKKSFQIESVLFFIASIHSQCIESRVFFSFTHGPSHVEGSKKQLKSSIVWIKTETLSYTSFDQLSVSIRCAIEEEKREREVDWAYRAGQMVLEMSENAHRWNELGYSVTIESREPRLRPVNVYSWTDAVRIRRSTVVSWTIQRSFNISHSFSHLDLSVCWWASAYLPECVCVCDDVQVYAMCVLIILIIHRFHCLSGNEKISSWTYHVTICRRRGHRRFSVSNSSLLFV